MDAALLLADALGRDRSWVLAHGGDELSDASLADQLLGRRLKREPLAYILGRREFFGREFQVSPAVLIPRQETETLVEAAMAQAPERARVLDIGAGSGCVAITLALERPDLHVLAVDVSRPALEVARQNAERLGARVDFIEGDGVEVLQEVGVDLVVTNPPYVGLGESLPPEVAAYEPALALFAGEEGLDFFRLLAGTASNLARPQVLLTEIGDGQAPAVARVFVDAGWEEAGAWRDLGGRLRVLAFRLP